MAMFRSPAPIARHDDPAQHAHHAIRAGRDGGRMATLVSLLALGFSGLSYYESALKQADLEIFVPPVIQYGRDGGGDVDVIAIPLTVSNGGSNTGTVLAMELTVENLKAQGDSPKSKTFYSAFLGEHPREGGSSPKSFAPIAVPGRGTYTETIRFYPQGNPLPKIVDDAGDFRFTLKMQVATPQEPSWIDRIIKIREPEPLVFERTLPFISHQHVNMRRGTISMHAKDWKPTTSAAK
jgi:hypothetical protein